jgi:phosphoglycerol transferase MdoB-like AlkP superfamily enzyme
VGVLAPALWHGLRYDLVTGAIGALLVASAAAPLWMGGRRQAAVRLSHWMGIALLLVFVLASLCEHFYYAFYKTRFDPILFGLFEDDTGAILGTVWDDYPVLSGLAALALVALVLAWSVPRATAWLERYWPAFPHRSARMALIAIQIALLVLLARGSIGTFPLVRRDVTVSRDPFVNALVLNAPLALYRAARQRATDVDIGPDPEVGLRKLGFANLGAAARSAGLPGGDPASVQAALFAQAPGQARPAAQSPHVVLALLESFGADLLATDGPGNDLLGRLRGELPSGYRFDRFYAGQNGTHPELENLLLGSPISPLTRGRHATLRFDTAAALPFKHAGYRTAFVYGGGADWRNIGSTFARQGFDRVYDARDIRHRFPRATGTEWGLYDEYLFAFASQLLAEADARGERLFLFLLTTTNHPPYQLDVAHRTFPLDPGVLGARAEDDRDQLGKTLATYQYQADQFGVFLRGVRESRLGERTLVAAAGDHNLRTHYRYTLPTEQPDVDRVFAWLRVPAQFAPPGRPDTAAFASHADLVPTLVSIALPGQRYFATGRNLWISPADGGQAISQFDRLYTREAVMFPLRAPVVHDWRGNDRISPIGHAPSPVMRERARRAAAWTGLRDWYIRRTVIRSRTG